jgi:hypothetical protein
MNTGAARDMLYVGMQTQRISLRIFQFLSDLGEIPNSRSVHNAVEHLRVS